MSLRSPHLLFARVVGPSLLAPAIWVAPALGQTPDKGELPQAPAAFVFGDVQCPNPKTVQQSVLSLIRPEHYALLEHGVRVELEDLGDSYRVTVLKDGATVKKRYSDPARDCDSRARFAAVFAVLTLMPPELGLGPLAQPEPAPAPKPAPKPAPVITPTPAPATTPALPPFARFELSALFAYAPAILEAPSLHSFGGELRVALGRGAFSGTLALAYMQRAQFDLNGVQADVLRLPMSIGARLRSESASWSVSVDLALLLVAQRVRATNLLTQHSDNALDVGVRAGAQIAPRLGPHFAPFLGAFIWFSPAPSEISALPQGVVGNLPYLWLGGAAGVSFGL